MAFDLDDEENEATRIANGTSKESRDKNMDIEVGEYVRTKNGYITEIDENTVIFNLGYKEQYIDMETTKYGFTLEDEIVKHSKQLIDLIEVGDYVNGREVKYIAMFEGFPDYPKLIFVDETLLIPSDTCENDEIKTILTKELYEANCYKVGGEENERI